MDRQYITDLVNFIVQAKQATYMGGGRKLLPYRLGSHDLQFFKEDWAYHDSYIGENDFMGEEIVYLHGKVVWGMNYYGRILNPDRITSAKAGEILQQSLSKMYQSGRFLGGFTNTIGEYTYYDANDGDAAFFTGKERIEREGEIVYELVYHGGLIKE